MLFLWLFSPLLLVSELLQANLKTLKTSPCAQCIMVFWQYTKHCTKWDITFDAQLRSSPNCNQVQVPRSGEHVVEIPAAMKRYSYWVQWWVRRFYYQKKPLCNSFQFQIIQDETVRIPQESVYQIWVQLWEISNSGENVRFKDYAPDEKKHIFSYPGNIQIFIFKWF